jgi:hypothetical protein
VLHVVGEGLEEARAVVGRHLRHQRRELLGLQGAQDAPLPLGSQVGEDVGLPPPGEAEDDHLLVLVDRVHQLRHVGGMQVRQCPA